MRGSVELSSEPPYEERLQIEIESLRQQLDFRNREALFVRDQLASRDAEIAALREQVEMLRNAIEKYLPECDHYSDNGVQFYAELLEALAATDGQEEKSCLKY